MPLIHSLAPYIGGTVVAALFFGWMARRNRYDRPPLPPGPKPLPLIGNLLDMPKEKDWETYRVWNERYGDVVYVEALGSKIVVLSSATVINELLEQRGAIYSSRPWVTMGMELMKFDWAMPAMPYGGSWRKSRRLLHEHMHQGVTSKYHPMQIESARKLALEILAAQQDIGTLSDVIRANVGRTLLRMVYGMNTEAVVSEQLSVADEVVRAVSLAFAPGHFLVDSLTFLKHVPAWLPGAGFQRFAQETYAKHRFVRDHSIAFVKTSMANGIASRSMAQAMLADDATFPPSKSELDSIKDTTAALYLAGSDTTIGTVVTFFLAMLVYPDIQRKAQAEIDLVVGKDRLPEMDDAPQLPYVQGVVNECLRWLPVTPIAVPHATIRDDVYKGYFIPKGTIVVGNAWAILHNPEDYPEPERFNPSRYLTPEGTLDSSVRDPRTACFGFGRRACPGRYIADASLFAIISTLLATVDVVRAKNEGGDEIVPEVDVVPGMLSHAKPFPWTARSRNRHAQELLAQTLNRTP